MPEDLGVPLAGMRHLRLRMFKPALHDAEGIVYRE